MWSQTLDYALRAMVQLAQSPTARRTVVDLAAQSSLPRGYLAKIMLNLLRANLVTSQRGLNGGFLLARPPEAISIWDVAEAVDPIKRITRCPMNNPDHCRKLCALHSRLDKALAEVEAMFRATPISTLVPATTAKPAPKRVHRKSKT